MPARKTLPKFIEDAITVHGPDKFDYSLIAEYKNGSTPVPIICRSAGHLFNQKPEDHLDGCGCPSCYYNKDDAKGKFIQAAKAKFGDRYDYSFFEFVNSSTNSKIVCNIHNHEFYQSPGNHIRTIGCSFCSGRRISLDDFKVRGNEAHGGKYDYALVIEILSARNDKLPIICPEHGVFEQTAAVHMTGHGCPSCGGSQLKTHEQFEFAANIIHDGKYKYPGEYFNSATPTDIECPHHGIFKQSPNHHTAGHGCPLCYHFKSKGETEWLGSLDIPLECHQKSIMIGKKKIVVDAFDPTTNTIYEFYGDYWHGNPAVFESDGMNTRAHKTFGTLHQSTLARESLIKQAGYNLVSIWESEWKDLKKKGNAA